MFGTVKALEPQFGLIQGEDGRQYFVFKLELRDSHVLVGDRVQFAATVTPDGYFAHEVHVARNADDEQTDEDATMQTQITSEDEVTSVLRKETETGAAAEVAISGARAAKQAAQSGANEHQVAQAAITAATAKATDLAFIAKAAEAELGRIAETTLQAAELHQSETEASGNVVEATQDEARWTDAVREEAELAAVKSAVHAVTTEAACAAAKVKDALAEAVAVAVEASTLFVEKGLTGTGDAGEEDDFAEALERMEDDGAPRKVVDEVLRDSAADMQHMEEDTAQQAAEEAMAVAAEEAAAAGVAQAAVEAAAKAAENHATQPEIARAATEAAASKAAMEAATAHAAIEEVTRLTKVVKQAAEEGGTPEAVAQMAQQEAHRVKAEHEEAEAAATKAVLDQKAVEAKETAQQMKTTVLGKLSKAAEVTSNVFKKGVAFFRPSKAEVTCESSQSSHDSDTDDQQGNERAEMEAAAASVARVAAAAAKGTAEAHGTHADVAQAAVDAAIARAAAEVSVAKASQREVLTVAAIASNLQQSGEDWTKEQFVEATKAEAAAVEEISQDAEEFASDAVVQAGEAQSAEVASEMKDMVLNAISHTVQAAVQAVQETLTPEQKVVAELEDAREEVSPPSTITVTHEDLESDKKLQHAVAQVIAEDALILAAEGAAAAETLRAAAEAAEDTAKSDAPREQVVEAAIQAAASKAADVSVAAGAAQDEVARIYRLTSQVVEGQTMKSAAPTPEDVVQVATEEAERAEAAHEEAEQSINETVQDTPQNQASARVKAAVHAAVVADAMAEMRERATPEQQPESSGAMDTTRKEGSQA